MDAARDNRWGHRRYAILLAYRHGLRACEWQRCAGTTSTCSRQAACVPRQGRWTSVHPLGARKLRALRRLQRETPEGQRSVHVFVSERLAPLSVAGYQRMVARAVAQGVKWPPEDRQRDRTEGAKAAREGCGYFEGGQVAQHRDWHGSAHLS